MKGRDPRNREGRIREREHMTQVMGIVNVTPDSFSDGGKYFSLEEAVRRAMNVAADGATIVDFGAESTRPGAVKLVWEEEWARLGPVLDLYFEKRKKKGGEGPAVSVDTYHPETALLAAEKGVKIINCVYPEPVPAMVELLRKFEGLELVMPAECLKDWERDAFVMSRAYLDPMIGFGTTREQDLNLIKATPELAKKGRVLVGASRKRIVKKLTGEKVTGKNIGGNLGIAVWCALNGASVVRVHDVKETCQALKVVDAIERGVAG